MATASVVVNPDEVADSAEAGPSDLSKRPQDARQVASAISMAAARRPNIGFIWSSTILADDRRAAVHAASDSRRSATGEREPIHVAAAVSTMIASSAPITSATSQGKGGSVGARPPRA